MENTVNRFQPDILVGKVVEVSLAQYPIYDHDFIYNSYRAHLKAHYRKNPNAKIPEMWKNFKNFTSWYFISNHPFLRDSSGKLFMPYNPKGVYNLCPEKPTSLISAWQRKILDLEPKKRGATHWYLLVEEYATGKLCKLRYEPNFNLELFKKKLFIDYFGQFFSLELNSNLNNLKTVEDFYLEVLNND